MAVQGMRYPTDARLGDIAAATENVGTACKGGSGKAIAIAGGVIGGLATVAIPPPGAWCFIGVPAGIAAAVAIGVGVAKMHQATEGPPGPAEVPPDVV